MGVCASSQSPPGHSESPRVAVAVNESGRLPGTRRPAAPPTPGEILDRYEVLKERLGTGATSDVFKGRVKASGKPVAVKVLDKLTRDAHRQENLSEDIQGARTEAALMGELSGSAHVADLLDFVETPAKIHTFLELVPGGELYDQLRLEPYTEAEAREHFRQMMLGMAHVHERGIVHRDIKPENILMMEPTRTAAIKIVDFGFAERVPKGGQLYERLGTPKYVAPEVWRADDRRGRGYGTNADIYAFGIILHQMLTGQEPFEYVKARWARAHPPEADQSPSEDRTQEFSEWAAGHNVPPMTETRAPEAEKITPEARDLIVRLLVRDPASRISAAEALEHAWFRAAPRPEPLVEAAERIKQFQARKRMMRAMNAVLFTARVKNVVGRLRQAAPRQATGDSDAALGVLDDAQASDSPTSAASKAKRLGSDRLAGPSPTAHGSSSSDGGALAAGVLVSGKPEA